MNFVESYRIQSSINTINICQITKLHALYNTANSNYQMHNIMNCNQVMTQMQLRYSNLNSMNQPELGPSTLNWHPLDIFKLRTWVEHTDQFLFLIPFLDQIYWYYQHKLMWPLALLFRFQIQEKLIVLCLGLTPTNYKIFIFNPNFPILTEITKWSLRWMLGFIRIHPIYDFWIFWRK